MEAERVRTESAVLEEQIKEKESAAAVLESTVTHNRENIQRAEAELARGGEPFRRPCEAGGGAGSPGGGDRPAGAGS